MFFFSVVDLLNHFFYLIKLKFASFLAIVNSVDFFNSLRLFEYICDKKNNGQYTGWRNKNTIN